MSKLTRRLRKGVKIVSAVLVVCLLSYTLATINLGIMEINRKIEIYQVINSIRNYQAQRDLYEEKNAEKMLEANFLMFNKNISAIGSGTHIMLKGQHFILTCAHLFQEPTDLMFAVDNEYNMRRVELVKYSREFDLALFRIDDPTLQQSAYVKLGTEQPKPGSRIIVVGNPGGEADIITDGIVAKEFKYGYMFTNLIYFGNSGGGIFYKGNLVGVATNLYIRSDGVSVYVNYGYGPNLTTIMDFLGGLGR